MDLIITLRKEVPDEATAQQIFELVQNRLADYPDVTIQAHTTMRLPVSPD